MMTLYGFVPNQLAFDYPETRDIFDASEEYYSNARFTKYNSGSKNKEKPNEIKQNENNNKDDHEENNIEEVISYIFVGGAILTIGYFVLKMLSSDE